MLNEKILFYIYNKSDKNTKVLINKYLNEYMNYTISEILNIHIVKSIDNHIFSSNYNNDYLSLLYLQYYLIKVTDNTISITESNLNFCKIFFSNPKEFINILGMTNIFTISIRNNIYEILDILHKYKDSNNYVEFDDFLNFCFIDSIGYNNENENHIITKAMIDFDIDILNNYDNIQLCPFFIIINTHKCTSKLFNTFFNIIISKYINDNNKNNIYNTFLNNVKKYYNNIIYLNENIIENILYLDIYLYEKDLINLYEKDLLKDVLKFYYLINLGINKCLLCNSNFNLSSNIYIINYSNNSNNSNLLCKNCKDNINIYLINNIKSVNEIYIKYIKYMII